MSVTFKEITKDEEKENVAKQFYQLLELCNYEYVKVEQKEPYSDIIIKGDEKINTIN